MNGPVATYAPHIRAETGAPPSAPAAGPELPVPSDAPSAEALGSAALEAAVPEIASGRWRLRSCRAAYVGRQRGKRIVLYHVSVEDARGRVIVLAPLIGKFYGRDRAAHADRSLHALWHAGFRPPSGHVVPRPYGQSAAHGVLLQGRVGGVDWADHLAAEPLALERASAQAASWLARLHAAPVPAQPVPARHDAAEALRFGRELAGAFPDCASRLLDAGALVAARLADPPPPAPSHGDFHPKNVFLGRGRVAVIDFDTFALREPAFDLGYAIGQLLCMARFRHGTFAPGLTAALAFWNAYAAQAAPPAWPRVAVAVARTLLQSLHFELCTLANGRLELLDLWPALIHDALNSNASQAFARTVRGR